MDDLISRQAALEKVRAMQTYKLFVGDDMILVDKAEVQTGLMMLPTAQPEPHEGHWIPVSERLPSKEERKEWIDNNLDGIGYLYPCLVTRYSSINPDRTKNNPYVAKHYFDGEDFLNAGEEVCSEYIIAWMPLPEAYKPNK